MGLVNLLLGHVSIDLIRKIRLMSKFRAPIIVLVLKLKIFKNIKNKKNMLTLQHIGLDIDSRLKAK